MGSMLPYAFSAMTMKAVGDAAIVMMEFIKVDYFKGQDEIAKGGKYDPDYDACIKISTDASLKKMVAPGALVLGAPLLAGFVFGEDAVAGLLAGAIVSGVQVAISASNTGGAWDNCKKEIEKERSAHRANMKKAGVNIDNARAEIAGMNADTMDPAQQELKAWVDADTDVRERHIAAVVGDTVGDPLKDTSGPAINILIKLSAITSLVFGNFIKENNVMKAIRDAKAAKAAENSG
jgi:inorganic pyrophosphatase